MAMQGKKVRWALKVVLVVLPFFLLEIGLRGYDVIRGASVRARASWYWGFTQDRFLGYRPRPGVDIVYVGGNHFDTNSEGFRDADRPLRNSQPKRLIVCVGESSTWGVGCSTQAETWPNQLERMLHASGREVDVLNAGMPGYTTVENAQLIKLNLLKYRPEVIIYMGFRNDYFVYGRALTGESADFNHFPRTLACMPQTFANDFLMTSSLYAFAAGRIATLGLFDRQTTKPIKFGEEVADRARELFADQVAEIASLCKRHDVRLLWVDQPVEDSFLESRTVAALRQFRQLLHEQLRVNEVQLIQAHKDYDFEAFPLLDDAHLSNEGNSHLAEIVERQLREVL